MRRPEPAVGAVDATPPEPAPVSHRKRRVPRDDRRHEKKVAYLDADGTRRRKSIYGYTIAELEANIDAFRREHPDPDTQ